MSITNWQKTGVLFQAASLIGILVAVKAFGGQETSLRQKLQLNRAENSLEIFQKFSTVTEESSVILKKAFPNFYTEEYYWYRPSEDDFSILSKATKEGEFKIKNADAYSVKQSLEDLFGVFEEIDLLYKEGALNRRVAYNSFSATMIKAYEFYGDFGRLDRENKNIKIKDDRQSIIECWKKLKRLEYRFPSSEITDEQLECNHHIK